MNKNTRPDTPAAPRLDRSDQDIGNIVEFGHLNLRVPDQQRALLFYVAGLGLTRDPQMMTGTENAWINVGCSQFHLPVGPAQRLGGAVGLVMPDLDALAERLARITPLLGGTQFGFVRNAGRVDLTCPWGNRIRVHASDPQQFAGMTLGMPYIEVDVATGTATPIARFYRELLGALASCGHDERGTFARVGAGIHGSLVYRETARALPPYDGHHVQITLADFSGPYGRLHERGLVSEESHANQYRFQDIVDLDSGAVLVSLEHEVRSMRHPQWGRPLVNRGPAAPQVGA